MAAVVIVQPKDKTVTFQEVLMLSGSGEAHQTLKVNGQKIKADPAGNVACGLVLALGKNLTAAGEQNLRLLRLKTFPDMEALFNGKKHWAHDQLVQLATLGLIEGYPDDNFYPTNPITRGEFATWLARLKKLPLPTLGEDVFFDVPKEHWRAPYIKAVVAAGYLRGFSDKNFGIDEPISRREAVNLVSVSEGLKQAAKIQSAFLDVPEEEQGALPIYAAREQGLVIGITEDIPIFDPDRALTRAEAAVLLARFPQALILVRDLFDFESGYTAREYCKLNIYPEISGFTAKPETVRAGEKTLVRLRVEIASREAFYPISKVKVDLAAIGGLPDTELFDDGTHGDDQKDDLTYSLNVAVEQPETGSKVLTASVIDRLGWESKKTTSLLVVE